MRIKASVFLGFLGFLLRLEKEEKKLVIRSTAWQYIIGYFFMTRYRAEPC